MSVWTEAKVEELKKLWAEGHTGNELSRRLKVSSSGCIAKAHRLKLPARTPGRRVRGTPAPKLNDWNEPDENQAEHATDRRDFAMLEAVAAGEKPGVVARKNSVPVSYVKELWRVREAQEPVGEMA